MILIFSKENLSTDYIIDNLIKKKNETIIRVDEDYNKCKLKKIFISNDINELALIINDEIIKNKDISQIIVKNGQFSFLGKPLTTEPYFNKEEFFVDKFISNTFLDNEIKPIFGFKNKELLKLDYLYYCTILKIKIPNTLITNNKNDLLSFYKKNQQILTKPIQENNLKQGVTNVRKLSKKDIENYPITFFATKFQQIIDKCYEVRTFYIEGEFYSGAIFDLANNIDIRDSLSQKKYTIVPYKLPKKIRHKLIQLLALLKLRTCSIDLLLDKSNNYYLIDITPNGIHEWLSEKCNYNLNYEITEKIK